MKDSVAITKINPAKSRIQLKTRSRRTNAKKKTITIPREDYLKLLKFLQAVTKIIGNRNDPRRLSGRDKTGDKGERKLSTRAGVDIHGSFCASSVRGVEQEV